MGKIATIGTFDGCHTGHQAVIEKLLQESNMRGLQPLLVTFSNHPLDIIAPERAPKSLMTTERKREMLLAEKVPTEIIPFTKELCALTVSEWIRRLRDDYDVEAIVLGYDNTFGSDGRTIKHNDYFEIGQALNVEIIQAPYIPGISSSSIRRTILDGEIGKANRMLGYHYGFEGEIVHGKALGRRLGFPTANMIPPTNLCIPANGVYVGEVTLPNGTIRRGVVNIGIRPTVRQDDNGERPDDISIEIHIPDWSGDLYGRKIELKFLDKIREERKFPDLGSLSHGIAEDIRQAMAYKDDDDKKHCKNHIG